MTRMKLYIIFSFALLSCTGCENLFIEDDPQNNPEENFEIFWKEFDRHYTFFDLKNIDWDSVYLATRPLIDQTTSSNELFNLLGNIIVSLGDGHSGIMNNNQYVTYDFKAGFPANDPINISNYINELRTEGAIEFSTINGTNLGYLRIKSFGLTQSDYLKIDQVLKELKDTGGIIIDVRSNGGGSDLNSEIVASRFTDHKVLYKKYKFRNGPDHNDFTDWFDAYVEPDGKYPYLNPVIVLTNRGSYSATEDFVLAMHALDHIRIVGDTTGGGSGNPLQRELPNGWIFQLSAWFPVSPDLIPYEGTGWVPDLPVWINEEDSLNGKDTILEEAINLLN